MKILKIFAIISLLSLFNISSIADTNQDCSQYTKKTLVGKYDKYRCEKGKPPRKKLGETKLGEKLKGIFKKN